MRTDDNRTISYDPRRLEGVTLYREVERAFAEGDRVQMTAPDRGVPNRELGTIVRTEANGRMEIQWDAGRTSSFEPGADISITAMRSRVTAARDRPPDAPSYTSRAERASEKLVNERFAYVAVSRGQYDARIFTDDKVKLARVLDRGVSHRSALERTPGQVSRQGTDRQISQNESIGHTMAVGSS
ncbi:MAG: hypothetical protein ABR606_03740 [Vicinamibacterales bacterium]